VSSSSAACSPACPGGIGSLLSGAGAYLSVRFLTKYFQTRTLTPFAIYCVVVGLGSIVYLKLL
jgi:undecaprenyl-diphosphatase